MGPHCGECLAHLPYGILRRSSADRVPKGCDPPISPSPGEDHEEVDGVVELGEVRARVDTAAEGAPNVPNGSSFSSSLGADPLPDIFVESKNITCEFSPLGALQSFQLRRCG